PGQHHRLRRPGDGGGGRRAVQRHEAAQSSGAAGTGARIEPERLAPVLELKVFTSPVHQINGGAGGTFSPTTATLVFGATEALLVDTLYMPEDIDALGDMIDGVGRRLTTI